MEKAPLRIKLIQNQSKPRNGESYLIISFKHLDPAMPEVSVSQELSVIKPMQSLFLPKSI